MNKLMILAVLATLTGCASIQQAVDAYGGAAIASAQHANDSYAKAWMAAACGTSVGAAMRNPESIPALKLLCVPKPVDAAQAADLLSPSARAGRE